MQQILAAFLDKFLYILYNGKIKNNPMSTLKDQAIKCALENKWTEAIQANLDILNQSPKDLDALNRLAYAYMQSKQFDEAKITYAKVIEMDKTNPIATKNLKKLDSLSSNKNGSSAMQNHINHMENVFIQEAGKTKTIELSNIADKKTIMTLQHGDDVFLTLKRSKIFVLSSEKAYIGMLPDNIGLRLTNFIKGGNEYQACIKGIEDKSVTIFIKETKRAKKFSNQPSFT